MVRSHQRSHPLVIRHLPWHIRVMRRRASSATSLPADDGSPANDAAPLQSLARWVQKNTQWLAYQLRRRDRSRADIDDLIQEAILKTVKSCEQGGVHDPAAVLVRTVSRLSMNDCRDRGRHPNASFDEIETFSPFIDPSPLPDEVIAAEQIWSLVDEVLDEVDPRMREAFLLHRMDGLSYRQIARQLHVSPVTVQRDVTWVMALVMNAARRRRRSA